jgi:hypothetical protein
MLSFTTKIVARTIAWFGVVELVPVFQLQRSGQRPPVIITPALCEVIVTTTGVGTVVDFAQSVVQPKGGGSQYIAFTSEIRSFTQWAKPTPSTYQSYLKKVL